jgi:hypothetical protein
MSKSDCIKAFICFSRQEYGKTPGILPDLVRDKVMFGNFDEAGNGTEYELSMDWIDLQDGKPAAPQLCMFNDAFIAIKEHAQLFKELVLLHDIDFTPDEFSRLLLRLGYKDLSDIQLSDPDGGGGL